MLSIQTNFYLETFFGVLIALVGFISRYIYEKLAKSYRFQLFGRLVTRVYTDKKVVALTYDDGPNPPYTNKLLSVLNKFQVKATFFVIGKRVENNRAIAQRILDEGHELGNHSYSHTKLINQSLAVIKSEVSKTDKILNELGVTSDIHFRAPLGLKRVRLPWELARRQKINVLWDVDPKDYKGDDPEEIADFVVRNVKPGSIILLHDGEGNRSRTVMATEIIAEQLQAKGYQFKTVSELMALQS